MRESISIRAKIDREEAQIIYEKRETQKHTPKSTKPTRILYLAIEGT